MTLKVEIGFDLTDSPIGPFLTLDDPVAGKLDDPDWTLAGALFYDVTEYVQGVSISRGKSRLLDKFNAGVASVVFDNTNRYFDPTYTASPFYGNIIPRREIRISVNSVYQFYGVIDDWNLEYEQQGKQTAIALASDGFTKLTNQTLEGGVQVVELSGERVAKILDDPGVLWPADRTDIDAGVQTLGADTIEAGENALSYLQTVEQSEPGRLFISKSGILTFRDRTIAPLSAGVPELRDDGTGINYQIVSVEYGSELLYNQIAIGSKITGEFAYANDTDSQTNYGIITLTQSGLLMNTTSSAGEIANYYAFKYSEPEFRFRQIKVNLDELTETNKNKILGLELNDLASISFTPGGVGDPIEKNLEVLSIAHEILPTQHNVLLGFNTFDYAPLVLDDAEFGKLDNDNALAF